MLPPLIHVLINNMPNRPQRASVALRGTHREYCDDNEINKCHMTQTVLADVHSPPICQ